MEVCIGRQPSFSERRPLMRGKTKEVWEHLCEQAIVEQDPHKLMQLVHEINRMLEEKENRPLRAREQDSSANA